MDKSKNFDLFGNPIVEDVILRDLFLEPPFSVLDTRTGSWQNRKRIWLSKGIQSEIGRGKNLTHTIPMKAWNPDNKEEELYAEGEKVGTSVFDPALTELLYRWYSPEKGRILDPFAGGSVRGIVANYLGFEYTGIELRPEQVNANRIQAKRLLSPDRQPTWIEGDSSEILSGPLSWGEPFDLIFSCPPYFDLEVYSDDDRDLSNMSWDRFLVVYREIIRKSSELLKKDRFAIFVVGDVRDKDGYYRDFLGETKRGFIDAGLKLYNDAILLNAVGSASMRANKVFSAGKKLVKIHQNVLIFIKP
jgi:DNA modification methylase